jgi:hypothetical protein
MEIKRSGSQPSTKGPTEYFIGDVIIDPLFQVPGPARAIGASVRFEPGARTAWHTHPLDQTLIVTSGLGWRIEPQSRLHLSIHPRVDPIRPAARNTDAHVTRRAVITNANWKMPTMSVD